MDGIPELQARVSVCRACPRLVGWRKACPRRPPGVVRGPALLGRPGPSFGDPTPRCSSSGSPRCERHQPHRPDVHRVTPPATSCMPRCTAPATQPCPRRSPRRRPGAHRHPDRRGRAVRPAREQKPTRPSGRRARRGSAATWTWPRHGCGPSSASGAIGWDAALAAARGPGWDGPDAEAPVRARRRGAPHDPGRARHPPRRLLPREPAQHLHRTAHAAMLDDVLVSAGGHGERLAAKRARRLWSPDDPAHPTRRPLPAQLPGGARRVRGRASRRGRCVGRAVGRRRVRRCGVHPRGAGDRTKGSRATAGGGSTRARTRRGPSGTCRARSSGSSTTRHPTRTSARPRSATADAVPPRGRRPHRLLGAARAPRRRGMATEALRLVLPTRRPSVSTRRS